MSFFTRKPQARLAARSAGRGVPAPAGRARRWFVLARRLLWVGAILAVAGVVLVKGREFLYESSYFQIRHIVIDGVGPDATAEIRSRLKTQDEADNLLDTSPRAIRESLLEIPVIRDISVRRHLPDTLEIQARERFPMAVLVGENNYLLDSELVVMGTLEGKDFIDSRLPLITVEAPPPVKLGKRIDDDRVRRAWDIVSELRKKSPEIAMRISETHVDREGDITLQFEGGTEVQLGRRAPAQVLPVLEAFYRHTDGMKNLEYAELEYRDQVAFKRRGDPPPGSSSPNLNARDRSSRSSH